MHLTKLNADIFLQTFEMAEQDGGGGMVGEIDAGLTLSRDIRRACHLLEKLQKSKYCGEVPATKLAALQKVLQSEFLNAVREVYEHVYETVDVEGSPDIRSTVVYILNINIFEHYVTLAHFGAVNDDICKIGTIKPVPTRKTR